MSKLKWLSIAAIGLLLINLCMVLFLFFGKPPHAQEGRRPFEQGPKNKIIGMLHFDKEQVEKYEELIKQHRTSVRLLEEGITEAKSNLYLTLNEKGSGAKDSLVNQLGDLQKQIENVHYNHFLEIKRLCKPDQQAYFTELTGNLVDFFHPEKQGHSPPKK
jgi:protein CpxP